MFTSNNVIIDIKKIFLLVKKKTILDINNLFWMAAYGEISLAKI